MSNPPILHPTSRQRLVRLCGMLGSDHDGERANAGRFADRLIREAGLTWDQLIAAPQLARPEPTKRPPPQPASEPWTTGVDDPSAKAEAILARHRAVLTPWEVEFLGSLTWRPLSVKQQAAFDRIVAKVQARGKGAA